MVEFQSNKHEIPIGLVEALSFVALLYGGIVTATLPWVFTNIYGGSLGGQLLKTTFMALFFLVTLRWLVIQYIALREFRNLPDLTALDHHPFVSILVPAFNEAPTINAAMRSLVGQNYPNYEVIFIDDGSTDGSYELAKQYEGEYGNATVRVVTKPNGGKWSALNHGYRLSTGEFILCVDADTRLDPDTLSFAVARMLSDERIGGLAGQVTIRNRNNFLTRLQALEYVRDNGANRMALSGGGVVTIVPGAIGLYRRQALDEVELVTGPPAETGPGAVAGPWSGETFAEDFQLSLTVLALGWRIIYEPRAVAFTKCPDRCRHAAQSALSLDARHLAGPAPLHEEAALDRAGQAPVAALDYGRLLLDRLLRPAGAELRVLGLADLFVGHRAKRPLVSRHVRSGRSVEPHDLNSLRDPAGRQPAAGPAYSTARFIQSDLRQHVVVRSHV